MAKERYAQKIGNKDKKIKHVLNNKLKPKGNKIIMNK